MALIAVILILALLMGLAVGLTTSVTMDTSLRGAYQRATTGFYAAESGLDRGMGDYRNMFLSFRVPTLPGGDFNAHSFMLGNRSVTYQLTPAIPDANGNATPQDVTIPVGQLFGGLSSREYAYIVNSTAVADGGTEANVSAEFNVGNIPIFQFAAFYTKDLEIEPGADMHLHGRVHTNGDLYLNSDAHLWIEDNQGTTVPADQKITTVQVTAKGDIHRGRKDDPNKCNGTVTVDMLQDIVAPKPDLDPKDLVCSGSGASIVPPSTLSAWKGSIVSHVQTIAVPDPGIIAKGTGTFWHQADLRIVLHLKDNGQLPVPQGQTPLTLPHAIEVQTDSGSKDAPLTALLYNFMTDVTYNQNMSSLPGTRPIFYTDVSSGNNTSQYSYNPSFSSSSRVYSSNINVQNDHDYRRGGFYNQREQEWMLILNINVHDLLDWNMQRFNSGKSAFFDPSDTTDGGVVIYASVDGPDSGTINNYGVRLFGSALLPFPPLAAGADPTGVTVASDQAMYVLGDYNSFAPKQPAAIIGDSINVLSNNYFNKPGSTCTNDCQSDLAFSDSNRDAATTTINAAFLGGVDTTAVGSYNGGLENYPRFHEDWSGRTLNYRGSFVSLGTPQHVNGKWQYGDPVYTAPNRSFDYDADFNDIANLPPLTPTFVYLQQTLFTEDFK